MFYDMLHHLSELLSFISEYSSTYSTCNTSVYWTGAIVTLSFLFTVKHILFLGELHTHLVR